MKKINRLSAILSTTILLAITLAFTKPVFAETIIHTGMWSKHFDNRGYNETHNLIGIEREGYFAVIYRNSQNDKSIYVGRIKRDWYRISDNWSLGYNYGLLTGYDIISTKIMPITFPVLSYDGFISFDMTYAYEAVTIQFRNSFNEKKYFNQERDFKYFIGFGDAYRGDTPGNRVYTIGVAKNKWKLDVTQFDTYTQSPWYDTNPEWRDYAVMIEKHKVYSLTKEILSKNFGKYKTFVDFGLAYSDKSSTRNTSQLNFRTNLGIAHGDFSLYLRHTSNANTSSKNAGEDAIMFEAKF